MRKVFKYSTFLVVGLGVIAMFVTATTYIQLGIAILLYPLLVYLTIKIFPRLGMKTKTVTIHLPIVKSAKKVKQNIVGLKREPVDIDKRAFLKIVGATGLSFFLFSLLNRRGESLLFGRGGTGATTLEDSAGNKIDPVERQPTDAYRISEIDDNNVITFCGYTNKDGAWFIMKEDTDTGSFRYTKGDSGFTDNWTNREKLKYNYFQDVF